MGYVRRKGREPIRKRGHRLEDRALDLGRRGAADAVPALQVVGDGLQIGRDGSEGGRDGLLDLGGRDKPALGLGCSRASKFAR